MRIRRLFSSCSSPAYVTGAEQLAAKVNDQTARVLYVVGGLYGNTAALDALSSVVRQEEEKDGVAVVFNGDFNFFNATHESWVSVNSRIRNFARETGAQRTLATLGNVELEVSTTPRGSPVGCGCAYPEQVDPDVALRAAEIVTRLHDVAMDSETTEWLRSLRKTSTWRVGTSRIGVVHGDFDCLNGWTLAAEAFVDDAWQPTSPEEVSRHLEIAELDVLACTHTCLAYMLHVRNDGKIVVNNGSAGMGNFKDDARGIVTRISDVESAASPVDALYSLSLDNNNVKVEAIPLKFGLDEWLAEFESVWPPGSPAHVSYHDRIKHGVGHWPSSRAVLAVDEGKFVQKSN